MSITFDEEVMTAFAALRGSKGQGADRGAITLKVTKDLAVQLDESYAEVTPEALAEDLSGSAPRFIIFSYKIVRDDGRSQYPLCFIYYSPQGGNPATNMLYTRAKSDIITKLGIDDSKCYDIQSADTLTHDWLHTTLCKSYTR
jgi:hypothetical protein